VDLDLNLLLVFSALLEEGSVTRAAKRLGVTPSAVSHQLAKLRARFDDPLFVRTPAGTAPTMRAEALRAPIARALEQVRAVFAADSFVPRESTRTFAVASTDYCEFVALPAIVRAVRAEAPNTELALRTLGDSPERMLASGGADLVIGTVAEAVPGVKRKRLFSDRFVCVVRKDHRDVGKRLDLDTFVRLPHALVAPRGLRRGQVDVALEKRGLSRRVALYVPHFFAVARVIAETDLLLTVPTRIADALARMLPIRVLQPPLDLPSFDTHLAWHERLAGDAGHAWLRSTIVSAATDK
jgi:DNA-binding transcriptional LysR family regulator